MLERWTNKADREIVLETLKRGIMQLTKLRHPQILTVQHPLEESRDSLAFATEPVFASLANVLGHYENISQPPPSSLRNYKLHDIEIRYGLLQLGEGLTFLHGDVKLLHRNLCPESIVINMHGAWKIFGFDLCALNQSTENKQPSWSFVEHNPTIPAVIQPHLDYEAPECILASSCSTASDIFALGMLIYVLHSPSNAPLHESGNDISKRKCFLDGFKGSIVASKLLPVPETLRDTTKLMLSHNPELRPDAHQFIKIEYFLDIGVKTLNYLDKIFQWDNLQKSQFYKGLPQLLKQLPHRVVLHRVLPALYKELVNPPMIPFVLPSILNVMETTSVEEFRDYILPNLKPVLTLEDPPQISLVLMQQVNLLLKLCPAEVVKTDIVPMLLRALESEWEQLQELCLSALPNIVTMIDGPVIKNAILPRMKKICLSHGKGNSGSRLGVRVNCLLCIAKMLPNFDRWLVFDQILPFLQDIPHAGEPAILMAIIGIYRMLLTHSKLGIGKEILATKILPFLLPLCVEQSLSSVQYETLSTLVQDMINRVTSEHREALRQLDAVRRETQQLDDALSQTTSAIHAKNSGTTNIPLNSEVSSTNSNLKAMHIENGLTMEDKFRLIQQQEVYQRLQTQAPLLIPATAPQRARSQPKDLTATLLKNNLDELNLSISTSKIGNVNQMQSQPLPTQMMSTMSMNRVSNELPAQTNWRLDHSIPVLNTIAPQNTMTMNQMSNGVPAQANWTINELLPTFRTSIPQPPLHSQRSTQMQFGLKQPENWNNYKSTEILQPTMIKANMPIKTKGNLSTEDITDLLS
ncbi:hypothetical protein KM043_012210 [Ampulex compressa]|nr:hypothetical protein KM043_012210 [Ampulex compressa]